MSLTNDGTNFAKTQISGTLGVSNNAPAYAVAYTGNHQTYEKNFNITITDNGPTDVALSNNTVAENTASGTNVGTLSTTGGASPYTYSLVSGAGDEDNSKFTISGDKLKLNFVPDYENPVGLYGNNVYTVRVRTSDATAVNFLGSISAGGSHTCAVLVDHTIKC